MKPTEKKPETVFRIINRETSEPVGSYSRAYCNEFDFQSVEQARRANCHGVFEDKAKYAIAKYRVTYELIDGDCDAEQRDEHRRISGWHSQPRPRMDITRRAYPEIRERTLTGSVALGTVNFRLTH